MKNQQERISLNEYIVFTVNVLATIKLADLMSELSRTPHYFWNKVALEMVLYSGLLIAFNLILFDALAWAKNLSNNKFEEFLFICAYYSILSIHLLPFLIFFYTL